MLRSAALSLSKVCRGAVATRTVVATTVRHSHGVFPDANDPDLETRYVANLSRADIDGWEIRRLITEMYGMDMVPEPVIVIAALKACRRVNDFALAIRYLESVKQKAKYDKTIWPWMLNEIKPTLTELGINTPDELGYGIPELYMKKEHEF